MSVTVCSLLGTQHGSGTSDFILTDVRRLCNVAWFVMCLPWNIKQKSLFIVIKDITTLLLLESTVKDRCTMEILFNLLYTNKQAVTYV